MVEISKAYKKKPRQVAPKGRRVQVSPEQKRAYEEEIRLREERERTYTRYLPGPDNKPGR